MYGVLGGQECLVPSEMTIRCVAPLEDRSGLPRIPSIYIPLIFVFLVSRFVLSACCCADYSAAEKEVRPPEVYIRSQLILP